MLAANSQSRQDRSAEPDVNPPKDGKKCRQGIFSIGKFLWLSVPFIDRRIQLPLQL